MRYQLKIIPKAQKDIDAISGRGFDYIKRKISALSENPRPFGCKKLTAEEGYRIRAGDFRILFRIKDSAREVIIYRVKYRKEAYR